MPPVRSEHLQPNELRVINGGYTICRRIPADHDTEMLAVKTDGESAWLVSEWDRRDRLDAKHIEKISCANDLGDLMCAKRQHTAPITRDQIVSFARLSHSK